MDQQLVKDIAVIITVFRCKKEVKLDLFEAFCRKTYALHYQIYPWARMSPSLHKLLWHGCEIARQFRLPMAFYAEDANESWHKLYRKNMTSHARQNSRSNRILDVYNRAIFLTDPKISLILINKRLMQKNYKKLSFCVKRFLLEGYVQCIISFYQSFQSLSFQLRWV